MLCSDGTLAAWGINGTGELGNNSRINSKVPVAVNMANGTSALFGKTVIAIAAGGFHNLALCSDGTLVAWGNNVEGALGDNSTTDRLVPVAVNVASGTSALFGKSVIAIAAGRIHSLALCSDGTLATWGWNANGELGDNTTTNRSVPVSVNVANGISALFDKSVIAVAAGSQHNLALCSDGTLVTWGHNGFGQLGNNDFSGATKRVPVAVNMANGTSVLFGKTITALAAGEFHSLAQCSDGALTAWGYNGIGQLGDNSTVGRFVPVAVSSTPLAAGERFILGTSGHSASHTLAIAAALPPPPPPAPEIELELVGSEANTPLVSGADTVPFGTVAPGSTVTQTFLIKNTGDASLDNLEVSLDIGDPDSDQFMITQPAENSIAPSGSRTFTATFAPDSAGSRQATLQVASNDADEGTFEVELTGTAVLSPEIDVRDGTTYLESTDTVAFGEVLRGTSEERVITIENTGNADLTSVAVSIVTAPGSAAWSFSELPQATVIPSATTSFTLRYTPSSYGPSAVTVQVASSDASENPFIIHFTGNGIADGPRVSRPVNEAPVPPATAVVWNDSLAGTYDGPLRHATTGAVIGHLSRLQLLPAVPRIRPNPLAKGTLLFQGRKVAIEAVISPSGAIATSLTEPLPGTGTLTLSLQVQRRDISQKPVIDGTVQWLGITARVSAPASGYSTTTQVPVNVQGKYTMAMPAEDAWGDTQPGGDGFATVVIAADGSVKFSGILGDGNTFSLTSYLSGDGEIPIYFPILRAGVARGLLAGTLVMRDLPGVSDFDGLLDFTRSADSGAKTYPAGFSVKVWALGNKYTAPSVGIRALPQLSGTNQNAQLSLRSPTFVDELTRWAMDWRADNTFAHYGPGLFSGSGGGTAGLVSGSVLRLGLPTSQTTAYKGVVMQKQGMTAGHFIYGSRTGSARIRPGNFPPPGSGAAGALFRPVDAGAPAGPPALTTSAFGTLAAGTYQGIIHGDTDIAGAIENMVVAKDGNFTATLWFLGAKHPLKDRVFPDGTVSITLTRPSLTPIIIALQLKTEDAQPTEFQFQGTITANAASFTVTAPRMPVYGNGLLRAPNRGVYTMAMLAPNGVDANNEPGGDGYAALSISYLGVCSGTFKLADGGTFTFANKVTKQGEWPLYRPLYGTVPKGWLAGSLTFRDVPNVSDLDGQWRWVKNNGAVPAAFPYSTGFSVTRQVIGCRYYAPVLPALSFTQLADVPLNAWLRLSGPDFSTLPALDLTVLDRAVTWTEKSTIITYGPDKLINASCAISTGVFSGTYEDKPQGVSQFIGGVLLQKQGVVTGHYLHGTKSGLMVIEPRN